MRCIRTLLFIALALIVTVGVTWWCLDIYTAAEARWIRAGMPVYDKYVNGNGPIRVWDWQAVKDWESSNEH